VAAGIDLEGLWEIVDLVNDDADLVARIERNLGVRVAVTDTIMADDERAEALARVALDLVR